MIKRFIFSIIFICIFDCSLYGALPKKTLLKVKSVTYQGNEHFKASQLNKLIILRPSTLIAPVYYNNELFQSDLAGIPLFYQQNGYLEARFTDYNVNIDSIKKSVKINFIIDEGELTRIEGISILNNAVISDQDIQKIISVKEGNAFKSREIENSTLAILRKYAEIGYLDTDINPNIRINSQSHTALIDFIIDEKTQYHIGNISITGLEKTKSNILLRELNFNEGEIVNYSKLLQSQRQLYLTGLFQSVFIRPVTTEANLPDTKDILIEAKEITYGEFNVSVGSGTVEYLRVKTEILYTNLWGTGQKIGLATKLSYVDHGINRGIELSFTEPWTFRTRWRTDQTSTWEYLNEPGYNLERLGARIAVGRKFMYRSNSTISYRHENNQLSQKIANIPADMESKIRALKLSLVFDNRDNLFNTSKGSYLEFSNEMAGSFMYGTNSFFRSNLRLKHFFSTEKGTVWGSSLDLGWIDAARGFATVPLNERFYAGGPNALRAFDYQRVGPLSVSGNKRIPLGGRYQFVWNVIEIRRPVYKSFGLEAFVDLGNVWDAPRDVAITDIRHSVGAGIRYNSPIGLARLDYAVNFSPRPGEDRAKIYFSMAQAF
ncbi:MAG: outer membrane protein assembly factor BamA [Candidatus Marinimicrobia bacterium]|nr:outer membrane protein assembly factor BamA [bacterium]MCG2717052.1 outer membrane protein assembly factor BamA [Candidatus Neomarinimicrobiota bacterium]